MMRDVTSEVKELLRQAYEKEKDWDPDTYYMKNPFIVLGQRDGANVPEWQALDQHKEDGLNLHYVRFREKKIDDSKIEQIGNIVALERDTGKTRLFFVWVPPKTLFDPTSVNDASPIDYHILFHPPTYEDKYQVPYWNGFYQKNPTFVTLGLRYLFWDYPIIAQHLLTSPAPWSRLVCVIPIAAFEGGNANFNDVIVPTEMMNVLREIGEFLLKKNTSSSSVGKIILSGYSRSGDRLVKMLDQYMNDTNHKSFFERSLFQMNAFDINLGDTDQQRLPIFKKFWSNIVTLKTRINRDLRVRVYTAYRSHADHIRNYGSNGGLDLGYTIQINFDEAEWSDKTLKKGKGQRRGEGIQSYNGDRSVSLVHIPTAFFKLYIKNKKEEVANPLGFSTPGHGHGWFLQTFVSHALQRFSSDDIPKPDKENTVNRASRPALPLE